MLVKLKTAVSGLEGSWGPGLRDLPEKLAGEMLAAGFAELVNPAIAAPKATPEPKAQKPEQKTRKGKG